MNSSESQVKPYNAILDVAGKMVGGFGLVLGLAYISGWVYLRSLYGKFDAPWIMDLFDAPAFVQAGLLWVVVCCVVSSIILICFRKADDIRVAAMGTMFFAAFGYVTIAFVASLLGLRIDSIPSMEVFGPLLMGLSSCYCIAAALRAAIENTNLAFALVAAIFGLILMVAMNPWMYSQTKSLEMKYEVGKQIMVNNKESGLRGLLIGIAGGKIILSECKTHEIYVLEPDAKTSFTKAQVLCE